MAEKESAFHLLIENYHDEAHKRDTICFKKNVHISLRNLELLRPLCPVLYDRKTHGDDAVVAEFTDYFFQTLKHRMAQKKFNVPHDRRPNEQELKDIMDFMPFYLRKVGSQWVHFLHHNRFAAPRLCLQEAAMWVSTQAKAFRVEGGLIGFTVTDASKYPDSVVAHARGKVLFHPRHSEHMDWRDVVSSTSFPPSPPSADALESVQRKKRQIVESDDESGGGNEAGGDSSTAGGTPKRQTKR